LKQQVNSPRTFSDALNPGQAVSEALPGSQIARVPVIDFQSTSSGRDFNLRVDRAPNEQRRELASRAAGLYSAVVISEDGVAIGVPRSLWKALYGKPISNSNEIAEISRWLDVNRTAPSFDAITASEVKQMLAKGARIGAPLSAEAQDTLRRYFVGVMKPQTSNGNEW
jgi:hypothetical protein